MRSRFSFFDLSSALLSIFTMKFASLSVLSFLLIVLLTKHCQGGLEGKSLEEFYPWLSDHLNSDRQITITTKDGNETEIYDLGETAARADLPIVPCDNPVFGIRGRCELLKECVLGPTRVSTFEDFLKHFCSFEDKFAGICC